MCLHTTGILRFQRSFVIDSELPQIGEPRRSVENDRDIVKLVNRILRRPLQVDSYRPPRAMQMSRCDASRRKGFPRRLGYRILQLTNGSFELPRKEVIQPHLPVRLPCYDFTPLTLHTFGASLTRLGRRLRVQTTRVV